jgi:hypothetical protein
MEPSERGFAVGDPVEVRRSLNRSPVRGIVCGVRNYSMHGGANSVLYDVETEGAAGSSLTDLVVPGSMLRHVDAVTRLARLANEP